MKIKNTWNHHLVYGLVQSDRPAQLNKHLSPLRDDFWWWTEWWWTPFAHLFILPSLKLTPPLKIGHPRRKIVSNHQFSGAMLVSGRVLLGGVFVRHFRHFNTLRIQSPCQCIITSSGRYLGSITILRFGDWIPRDSVQMAGPFLQSTDELGDLVMSRFWDLVMAVF